MSSLDCNSHLVDVFRVTVQEVVKAKVFSLLHMFQTATCPSFTPIDVQLACLEGRQLVPKFLSNGEGVFFDVLEVQCEGFQHQDLSFPVFWRLLQHGDWLAFLALGFAFLFLAFFAAACWCACAFACSGCFATILLCFNLVCCLAFLAIGTILSFILLNLGLLNLGLLACHLDLCLLS